jgi:hypothetical protein
VCWFITVGIQEDAAAALEALGRRRGGLSVCPSRNPHVTALFPPNDATFEVTNGGCSCDLWLAPLKQAAGEREKRREQYRKKGWSEAKIERALNAAAAAHLASANAEPLAGPRATFRRAIADQVATTGSVHVFAHFYKGNQDHEHVVCTERRRIPADEFLDGDLPGDVLLEVVP